MSWATLQSDSQQALLDHGSDIVQSEEAIIHSLRSAYSNALHSLTMSKEVDDRQWKNGISELEHVFCRCSLLLTEQSSCRDQILGIAYLTNKNRIDCLSRSKQVPTMQSYELSLQTINIMMDLGKSDNLLVLQTARYAKEVGDMWTYNQLMLLTCRDLPYMYKDLILKEFQETTMHSQISSVNLNCVMGNFQKHSSLKIVAPPLPQLQPQLREHLRIVAEGVVSSNGTSFDQQSTEYLLKSFSVVGNYPELAGDDPSESVALNSPAEVSQKADAAPAVPDSEESSCRLTEPRDSTSAAEETALKSVSLDTSAEALPERRSGRGVKRTRAGASLAGLEGDDATSTIQPLESTATSSSENDNEDTYIHAMMNLLKLKVQDCSLRLEGNYMTSDDAEMVASETQAHCLLFDFVVPFPVGDAAQASSQLFRWDPHPAHSGLSSPHSKETAACSSPVAALKPTCSDSEQEKDNSVWVDQAQQVLAAYIDCAVHSDDLIVRRDFYVRFLEFLADESNWAAVYGINVLDLCVMQSWAELMQLHPGGEQELLDHLSASEELLLLECALSVVRRRVGVDRDRLVASSYALAHRLLPKVAGVRASSGPCSLRSMWILVSAMKLFGVAAVCPDGPRSVLLAMIKLLLDPSGVHTPTRLPHVFSSQWSRIDRKICDGMLSSLKYENEVKSLLSVCTGDAPWIEQALRLIRFPDQLRIMLSEKGDDVSTTPAVKAQTVPMLLLEACQKKGSESHWADAAAVLLQEAVVSVVDKQGGAPEGDKDDCAWVRDLMELMVVHPSPLPWASSEKSSSSAMLALCTLLCYFSRGSITCELANDMVVLCLCLADAFLAGNETSRDKQHAYELLGRSCMRALYFPTTAWLAESSAPGSAVPRGLAALWTHVVDWAEKYPSLWSQNLSDRSRDYIMQLLLGSLQRLDNDTKAQVLRCSLLGLLLSTVSASKLFEETAVRGEFLALCLSEIQDQRLHCKKPPVGRTSSRASRAGRAVRADGELEMRRRTLCSRLVRMFEQLVFSADLSTCCTQREQRDIAVALGQLYHSAFGLSVFPYVDEEDGEQYLSSERFCKNNPSAADLECMYRFVVLCWERGWAAKAEIRLGLLQLSRSPVLITSGSSQAHVSQHLLCQPLQDLETAGLVSHLRGSGESCTLGNELNNVRAGIYHDLLQLGFTASDLADDEHEESEGESEDAARTTTLQEECDMGPYFEDPRHGFTISACLQDIRFNPLRTSSWNTLFEETMDCFNALSDELQKEMLVSEMPEKCFRSGSSPLWAKSALFPGFSQSLFCIWQRSARISKQAFDALVASAVDSIEEECGDNLIGIFEPTLALETRLNRMAPASPGDPDAHYRRLVLMLVLRDACLEAVLALRRVLDALLAEPAEQEFDAALAQRSAELFSLVISNACKCRCKENPERLQLKLLASKYLEDGDKFFGDDLFSLVTTARAHWSCQAKRPGVRCLSMLTTAVQVLPRCVRAARLLRPESSQSRGVLSKPVRIAVIYHISTFCIKICLYLLRMWTELENNSSAETNASLVLREVEMCLAALAKWQPITPAFEAESGGCGLLDRVWLALCGAITSLKQCRRIDAFDFRSVYRSSVTVLELGRIVRSQGALGPPAAVLPHLDSLGLRSLHPSDALEEMSKLFDKKRPQILAMWCVENASNAWEKVLAGISQFDNLRRKYVDWYLFLVEECLEVEVVLDVIAFALAATKHATAVVLHVLHQAIAVLSRVVTSLLLIDDDEEVPAEICAKAAALKSGAERSLQLLYEAHSLLLGKLRPAAQEQLYTVLTALFPHSSLRVCAQQLVPISSGVHDSVMDVDCVTADADFPAAGTDSCGAVATTINATTGLGTTEESPYVTESETNAVLSACVAKWGTSKQLQRTEIGKRNKGCFQVAALERSNNSKKLAAAAAAREEAELRNVVNELLNNLVVQVIEGAFQ